MVIYKNIKRGFKMILITGATGNIGNEVVNQLADKGEQVRILSRNPEKVSWPANVDIISGDLTNTETVKIALDGVQKVYFIHVPGSDDFLQIAKQAGVRHIVFLSSNVVTSETETALVRMHLHTERLLRQSGVKWTFLRPEGFMSNAFQWADSIRAKGKVYAPFGDVAEPLIDPKDIAAVAVETLIHPGHEGKIYTMTGPEMITPKKQVQILEDILDQSIPFEDLPEDVALENMKKFAPNDIADAVFQLKRDARIHPVGTFPTVEELIGRKARTFEQWAIDNANAFH